MKLLSCDTHRILVCKNEKNRRISLYSIFIDPSNLNYFAVSGRDQWARYVHACLHVSCLCMYHVHACLWMYHVCACTMSVHVSCPCMSVYVLCPCMSVDVSCLCMYHVRACLCVLCPCMSVHVSCPCMSVHVRVTPHLCIPCTVGYMTEDC